VKPVLVISERDNVATALETLQRGREIEVQGATIVVAETVPAGHKIALRAIPSGADVVKYGSPIGTATTDVAPGMHVHTHNVASTRGRGDLAASSGGLEQRLAEPSETSAPVPSGEKTSST
jgi:altronate dehydratase